MSKKRNSVDFVYSAYEVKSGNELCIASADTQHELAEKLGLTTRSVRRRIKSYKDGLKIDDYYIMKVVLDDEDED